MSELYQNLYKMLHKCPFCGERLSPPDCNFYTSKMCLGDKCLQCFSMCSFPNRIAFRIYQYDAVWIDFKENLIEIRTYIDNFKFSISQEIVEPKLINLNEFLNMCLSISKEQHEKLMTMKSFL